jgi:hypothetical protein
MKRNTRHRSHRRSKTHRRKNRRFSRKRATRGQRGGFYAQRPKPYATDMYWVAGEEEAPRMMTAEEIEKKHTEDDKGV